jgi:hypothetical protein
VIRLRKIEVGGTSSAGEFAGSLELGPGIQVISAPNSYGKSLAVKSVAWSLGLEPIFGSGANDPVSLPEAVRSNVDFADKPGAAVLTSECSTSFTDDTGKTVSFTRSIVGGDPSTITVIEIEPDGKTRQSNLLARKATMQDEHGGFQRFFFEWLQWPRVEVPTYREGDSEMYLENLAPLFYIDQNEGWSDIQALQISRYGQQEIRELAVEYLLGAKAEFEDRIDRIKASRRLAELKESARLIAEQVMTETISRGWRVEWSGHGSVPDIATRWSKRNLLALLKDDASVDLAKRQAELNKRIDALRVQLTSAPIDKNSSAAPIAASQRAIDLKKKRHQLNQDLSTLNSQLAEASSLLENLEHRLHTATDLLRLKTTGVGRIETLECPTCHRDIDPSTFGLSSQSAESVSAHIDALRSDRELISRNKGSISASVTATVAAIAQVDSQFREAELALADVTSAVGPVREQLAVAAMELTAAERESQRLSDTVAEIDGLQKSIDRWITDAKKVTEAVQKPPNVDTKRQAFVEAFGKYLLALGHSAVTAQNVQSVTFDDQYTPFLGGRRLRSLGSASDQSRLIAAYSLALAAASQASKGQHPGFVLLDEPLQQNPDQKHRDLFLTFLTKALAKQSKFQTVIATWLPIKDIELLRAAGTTVITPAGEQFLQLVKKPSKSPIAP